MWSGLGITPAQFAEHHPEEQEAIFEMWQLAQFPFAYMIATLETAIINALTGGRPKYPDLYAEKQEAERRSKRVDLADEREPYQVSEKLAQYPWVKIWPQFAHLMQSDEERQLSTVEPMPIDPMIAAGILEALDEGYMPDEWWEANKRYYARYKAAALRTL